MLSKLQLKTGRGHLARGFWAFWEVEEAKEVKEVKEKPRAFAPAEAVDAAGVSLRHVQRFGGGNATLGASRDAPDAWK